MGRAIVRDPQVFLFDEPLSNLDAKLRVAMRTEIKELHQRLGTTTVYVTHDQIEAMTMADKIVVMHDGVVEQIGAPLDLYDRPRQPLRRRLHRLAGHELLIRRAGDRTAGMFVTQGGVAPAARRGSRAPRREASRWSTASGPSIFRLTDGRHPGRGRRGRADRLGDAGRGADRRAGDDRRLPRAGDGEAGRDHPASRPTRRSCISSIRNQDEDLPDVTG